ncbi:MAG: hypothetical protein DID89_2727547573 [Candidatus Nitrotoga sp. CP45]|nr:MAG: hypothetical protein DID89_2727547573 [Candidatus Nitrotoga sp. CP45]
MFLVRRDHVAPLVAGLEPLRALAGPALLAEKPLARSSRTMRGLVPTLPRPSVSDPQHHNARPLVSVAIR